MLSFALTAVLMQAQASAPPPPVRPMLFKGLGTYTRHISTKSPQAQRIFDQGLKFMYAFNEREAVLSFRDAARLDKNCAIAWWGVATAYGPNINNPSVSAEDNATALQAIGKAVSLESHATDVEKALIEAARVRFDKSAPADRHSLDLAYAVKMRDVWKRFPDDDDVAVLFAEAMLDLRPWDQWKSDGTPQPGTREVEDVLRTVLARSPRHPQANHLYIHVEEGSPTPGRAVAAANRLRTLQPGLGHMVHMPSHIDVRVGNWKAAVQANELAIDADREYFHKRPRPGPYMLYMAHNRHMLAYAAMMRGQKAVATSAVQTFSQAFAAGAGNQASAIDGYTAVPYEVRRRFGQWQELLDMPGPGDAFPLATALWHEDRAIAQAVLGHLPQAREEQALFLEAKSKVPAGAEFGQNRASAVLEVADHLLAGEISVLSGDVESGLVELREAVQAEDALHYDEPPEWIMPTRHTLGAALLVAKRAPEAERVYREDLRRLPNNGWSLFGLSQALAAEGKDSDAAASRVAFRRAFADADVDITSSCLCLPNAGK